MLPAANIFSRFSSVVTAVLGLLASTDAATPPSSLKLSPEDLDSFTDTEPLILKTAAEADSSLFIGHRSHSSHSSHRSHSSHYSGTSGHSSHASHASHYSGSSYTPPSIPAPQLAPQVAPQISPPPAPSYAPTTTPSPPAIPVKPIPRATVVQSTTASSFAQSSSPPSTSAKPVNSYAPVVADLTKIEFANGFVLQCTVLAASNEGIQVRDATGKTYKFLSKLLSKATLTALEIAP
jgi:hypothetical protein